MFVIYVVVCPFNEMFLPKLLLIFHCFTHYQPMPLPLLTKGPFSYGEGLSILIPCTLMYNKRAF